MNLTVKPDPSLDLYDTGGGCCEVTVTISFNPDDPKHIQRRAVIHEVFESMVGCVWPHDKIEDAEDMMVAALEDWESALEEWNALQ